MCHTKIPVCIELVERSGKRRSVYEYVWKLWRQGKLNESLCLLRFIGNNPRNWINFRCPFYVDRNAIAKLRPLVSLNDWEALRYKSLLGSLIKYCDEGAILRCFNCNLLLKRYSTFSTRSFIALTNAGVKTYKLLQWISSNVWLRIWRTFLLPSLEERWRRVFLLLSLVTLMWVALTFPSSWRWPARPLKLVSCSANRLTSLEENGSIFTKLK